MAANALKKINARVKVLQKKHPNAKRRTLQKQAGKEYKAGKLKPARKRKPAKVAAVRRKAVRKTVRRTVRRKAAPRKRAARRRVAKVATVARVRRRSAPRKKKTVYRRRVSGTMGGNKSLMPILLIGGLGLVAYMLLKPATVPTLITTTNATRNASTNSVVAYATALGLGASAIAKIIDSLNSDDDDTAISASNNPASYVQSLGIPTSTVVAPTGGPSITLLNT